MNESEKKEITERLSARISTGLYFIEFNYLDRHEKPDPAWIRNIYILLSFYTELLFKQIFILTKDFENVNDLDNKLKKLGHDLELICQEIGQPELEKLGIEEILFTNMEYLIKTKSGDFYVKNFNDIRYDFLDGRIRKLNGNEHIMFKQQIEIMLNINNLLKPLAWR
ncbi:MAG: hypothetical protein ABIJ28_01320 [Patescibacteria group bacterium]